MLIDNVHATSLPALSLHVHDNTTAIDNACACLIELLLSCYTAFSSLQLVLFKLAKLPTASIRHH